MGGALKKYIWILGILCTIAISYLLAKMATLFIEGTFFSKAMVMTSARAVTDESQVSEVTKGKTDIEVILKRNFFDAAETVVTEKPDTEKKPPDVETEEPVVKKDPLTMAAVETSLGIKLYSTFSVGDGRNLQSSCVVKTSKSVETFTLKDKNPFGQDTKIVRILSKKVEFINKDRLEYVLIEEFGAKGGFGKEKPKKIEETPEKKVIAVSEEEETPASDIKREGDVFKIPRPDVDAALTNLAKLYTDIRAVPYFKEGKAQGFKLLSVKRGSFFQKLGLRRGDILISVNDRVLDIQSGMETFNTLKSENAFKLQLERRGEEKTFSYEITE